LETTGIQFCSVGRAILCRKPWHGY